MVAILGIYWEILKLWVLAPPLSLLAADETTFLEWFPLVPI